MTTLGDFRFEGDENSVTTPTLPTGERAKVIFRRYQEVKERLGNSPSLKLQLLNGELVGSNIFDVAVVDEIVRPFGLRTPSPVDLGNGEFIEMIRGGKHYADANALVLRSVADSYDYRHSVLAGKLAEYVDLSKGPALITGFRVEPADEVYGLQFVPGENFEALYDERLAGRWNEYRFDNVDEKGLPLDLDKRKGNRRWGTRKDGLSRFVLDWDSDLGSGGDQLDYSVSYGRVGLFGGEAKKSIKVKE